MDTFPYASAEAIAETVALIGEPIAGQECALLKQIVLAAALRSGASSVYDALGSPLGETEVVLLKQLLVLVATT